MPIKSVCIKDDICLAHMLCEGEAPTIFYDDGKSDSVSIKQLSCDKYNLEKDNIFSAAYCCPIAAIEIEFESGLTVDGDSKELDDYFRKVPNSN